MKSATMMITALLGVALLLGVNACAGSNEMMGRDKTMDKGMDSTMENKADGMLMGSEGHHAAGQATLGMGMGDKTVLTLSDIKVDKVPDGIVYLTKHADHRQGVELGRLEQFSGTVSFEVPAGVNPDDYDSVVIWCRKFDVEIGRAYLPKKMM
jgi:hypothetical protein